MRGWLRCSSRHSPAREIADRIAAEIARTFRTAGMSAQLRNPGSEIIASSPEEFAKFRLSGKGK